MSNYKKPEILLLNFERPIIEAIQALGLNSKSGVLGHVYEVEVSSEVYALCEDESLPFGHSESDVVVVNLTNDVVHKNRPIEKHDFNVAAVWVSHEYGHVDPLPIQAANRKRTFDRILLSGGLFIFFASPRRKQEYQIGKRARHLDRVEYSNWSILSLTEDTANFQFTTESGNQIFVIEQPRNFGQIASLLSKYTEGSNYLCAISPQYGMRNNYQSIAINKFGNSVSGVLKIADENHNAKGWILFFPDIKDKQSFLTELFSNVLPDVFPSLFPEHAGSSWKDTSEYAFPEVLELQRKIASIQSDAENRISALESSIDEINTQKKYLFDLIVETGDALVKAVIKTLRSLGFTDVIDVDAERDTGTQKMEDIQLKIGDSTLLIEVKGISGLGRDEDFLTVHKYVPTRMKEWSSFNVNCLSIINHQRNLPPLRRDNSGVFRDTVCTAAMENGIGLMTTWQLHKLARSFLRNSWTNDKVADLFLSAGPVPIVPTHYEFVGTVVKRISEPTILGINVVNDSFQVDDTLAFSGRIEFFECKVQSLELDNIPVEVASVGSTFGVTVDMNFAEIQIGQEVYRVT